MPGMSLILFKGIFVVYNLMISAIFSIFPYLPFLVSLLWLIVFAAHFRSLDLAKRILLLFALFCTSLYFCHALFFTGHRNILFENVWSFCSLSVYPLYYIYIVCLTTTRPNRKHAFYLLLPGILVALYAALSPGDLSDFVRKMTTAIQILFVCYFGIKRLDVFDRELQNIYADSERMSTSRVRILLVFFVVTSIISATVNVMGRDRFDNQLIIVPSVLFSVMLFILFYIGFTRDFSVEEYKKDIDDAQFDAEPISGAEKDIKSHAIDLELVLSKLMNEKHMYLRRELKIVDVAREAGSCRTYVSAYINQTYNCSFSDYINRLRINHAMQLMKEQDDLKMQGVAIECGYVTEQSFYRNFKKFTGMTPTEWMHQSK